MGNFSTHKTALTEIAARIQANRKRVQQAQNSIAQADADLAAMPALYAAIMGEIDADAAAAPADDVLRLTSEQKDKLVVEFAALKIITADAKTAIDVFSV